MGGQERGAAYLRGACCKRMRYRGRYADICLYATAHKLCLATASLNHLPPYRVLPHPLPPPSSLFGHAPEQSGELLCVLGAMFLNNSSSRWEQLLEAWPLELHMSDPINPIFKSSRTQ